jgi:hypothetical protein
MVGAEGFEPAKHAFGVFATFKEQGGSYPQEMS